MTTPGTRAKSLSLRFKFMAAMTVIPLIGLLSFLLLAKSIFEKDKIAYVFDSSLSVSKTRAARVSSEVSSVLSIAQAIVLSYRSDTKNLSETGTYYFDRETKFEAFQLFAWNAAASSYDKNVDLAKPTGKRLLAGSEKQILEIVQAARGGRPIAVRNVAASADRVLLAARFGEANDPKHVVAVALFEATELARIFAEAGPYSSFLAQKTSGETIFRVSAENAHDWTPDAVWATLAEKKIPEGIEELSSSPGVRYLASFSDVGVADLVVVSMVDRRAALQAVDVLLRKSLFFFFAVIAATLMIAVVAARSMTFALSKLSLATESIAGGNFDVRVQVDAGGEIGRLAEGFNAMATEVSRLMKETAEKARMESELATARTVQETLFPEARARLGTIEINGHYVPASECGGDWWFYNESDDGRKVYIWVGDATGHGAPAALLTSAARAVASVIASGPPLPPSVCLSILNRAICETSKGKMMMTFFLACIDKETGEMSYANASHEPPLLLHRTEDLPGREDFVPLNEINNPRLGEQIDRVFKDTTVQLSRGDCIVFYTDGVVDVKNPEGKTYGERRFMKALGAGLSSPAGEPKSAEQSLSAVVTNLEEFRGDTALDDDVTLVLCRFGFVTAADSGAESAVA